MTNTRLIIAAAAGFVLIAGGVALWMQQALSDRAASVPSEQTSSVAMSTAAVQGVTSAPSSTAQVGSQTVESNVMASPAENALADTTASMTQSAPVNDVPDGSFDTAVLTQSAGRAGELINELRAAGDARSSQDLDRAMTLQQDLLDLAQTDDAALSTAIEAFRQNPGIAGVDMLGDVLGQVRDPRVEAAAVSLVQSTERDHMLSGLKLIGDLKLPNRQTFNIVLDAIHANPHDSELLASAMYALPKVPMSSEDTSALIGTFQSLTNHADSSIRSESMFKIAQFAKTPEELQPVVNGLSATADDDRISAAMAIQSSPVVSDDLRAQLLARVSDEAELWEVRAMAADSLERFSLSGDDFAQYEDFRRQQDTVATQAPAVQ